MALQTVYCVFCFSLDITQLLTNFLDSRKGNVSLNLKQLSLDLLTFTKQKEYLCHIEPRQ